MHGCIAKWLARTLATGLVLGLPAISLGQNPQLTQGSESSYLAFGAEQSAPSAQFASSSADTDLAARVAKLEEALKKAEDKAAADKKKAAGKMSANIGGLLQIDMAGFQQNDIGRDTTGNMQNGCEFRRARLWAFGDGFDVIEYKVEMDFATTDAANAATNVYTEQVAFKDVFIAVKELPLAGRIQVGHFKEPFGL
jgi:phosphate-selective porin OprO/OprP